MAHRTTKISSTPLTLDQDKWSLIVKLNFLTSVSNYRLVCTLIWQQYPRDNLHKWTMEGLQRPLRILLLLITIWVLVQHRVYLPKASKRKPGHTISPPERNQKAIKRTIENGGVPPKGCSLFIPFLEQLAGQLLGFLKPTWNETSTPSLFLSANLFVRMRATWQEPKETEHESGTTRNNFRKLSAKPRMVSGWSHVRLLLPWHLFICHFCKTLYYLCF